VLLCEGESEVLATRRFLRRQFEADGLKAIGLHPINLKGKLLDIPAYAVRYSQSRDAAAVFTFVDLYGNNAVVHRPEASLEDKVSAVRDWLRTEARDVPPDFFHAHVSVHELEAWFLAEGKALGRRLRHTRLRPDRQAEHRNLGNPPQKRVNALFHAHLRREYRKIRDGGPMLSDLAHDDVYKACQYYREFYDDLTSTARAALAS